MTENGVRARVVLAVAAITAVVGWTAATAWRAAGRSLPDPGWQLLVPLALIAVVVLALGLVVRAYVRSAPAGRPAAAHRLSPQRARATLGAAQAAALGGALLSGALLAPALVLVADVDVPTVRADVIRCGVLALVSLGVAGVGLLVQSWCRVPPEDDDETGGTPADPVTDR